MTKPFLSIIIPAYNEQSRLPNTLVQAIDFINNQSYKTELLVVENGSQDNTYKVAQDFSAQHPQLRVLQEFNRGKGLAVRRGMLEASGEYRFMCDADLSMPIKQINQFIPPMLKNVDVAISSREVKGAKRYNEPLYRHLGGRSVNFMIRAMVLPGIHDTQCGFKCFRDQVARDLFSHQTLTGWSFDVEILFIGRKRGYKIVEVPIEWYFDKETKLRAVKDTILMFRDLLQIRRNNRNSVYDG